MLHLQYLVIEANFSVIWTCGFGAIFLCLDFVLYSKHNSKIYFICVNITDPEAPFSEST